MPSSATQSYTERQLGDFELRERLGVGGYGEVFRAVQAELNREVVVKVPTRRLKSHTSRARFLNEAKLASKIDHPYAAHIYGYGVESDGLCWIAMEYVRGTTLSDIACESAIMSIHDFVPLFTRLCEVVHQAHEQGIVHCDLKPANVMVIRRADKLMPKLLDLGVARAMQSGDDDQVEESVEEQPQDSRRRRKNRSTQTTGSSRSGSPAYMPPEQWINNGICAQTDIYSLGILAYEMLTGRRPFTGASLHEVAAAHARADVPPMGEGFASALDGVMRKAMAKRVADRYDSALEFAAEFRKAAGFAAEDKPLPKLPHEFKKTQFYVAPEPMARALQVFESCHNIFQARDALWYAYESGIRYIGLLCLAAARTVDFTPDEDCLRAIDKIRSSKQDPAQWGALARAVTRNFVESPQSFPIPELIALLHGSDALAIDDLVTARGWANDVARTETELGDHVEDYLERLPAFYNKLKSLADYQIRSFGPFGGQLWTGISTHAIDMTSASSEGVELVDSDGNHVLTLSPLFSVQAPTPEADARLFHVIGGGRAGRADLHATGTGFSATSREVVEWLAEFGGAEGDNHSGLDNQGPYRGLAGFGQDDADLFFGREREVSVVVNRLETQPLVSIVGPSGSGKSSFVFAGVLPEISRARHGQPFRSTEHGWTTIDVRPGNNPLAVLENALAEYEISVDLHAHPEQLGSVLAEYVERHGCSVIVVIDQFEEIFTLGHTEAMCATYLTAIASLSKHANPRVRAILTLRDDYLAQAERHAALRGLISRGLLLLTTPSRADLRRVVVEPARIAGYDFEADTLVDQMIDEVADEPSALAMLSFTCESLWKVRDRSAKCFTKRSYCNIGGISGALASHAESTLKALPKARQAIVRKVFEQLVTADGTRAVLTRKDLELAIDDDSVVETVDHLLDARLLVTTEREDGKVHVEIVHETLIGRWPRLRKWHREAKEGHRFRDQLRTAAQQWDRRGRNDGMLWTGDTLLEYQLWKSRHAPHVDGVSAAFISASERTAGSARNRKRLALVASFAILSGAVVGLWRMNATAESAKDQAEKHAETSHRLYLANTVEQGRRELLRQNPEAALLYFERAQRDGEQSSELDIMITEAGEQLLPTEVTKQLSPHGVRFVTPSPDGERLVVGMRTMAYALLLDKSGQELGRLSHESSRRANLVPYSASYSPDGKYIVTSSWGQLRVWSRDGELLRTIDPERDWAFSWTEYSADGRYFATASMSGNAVEVYRVADGKRLAEILSDSRISRIRASKAANLLVIGTEAGEVIVHSFEKLHRRAQLHGRAVVDMNFSADGDTISSIDTMGHITMQSATTGDIVARARGHHGDLGEHLSTRRRNGFVRAPSGGPDDILVADGSTVRAINLRTGEEVARLKGHAATVMWIDTCSDKSRVVTASIDGTARVYAYPSGAPLATLRGHRDRVSSAHFVRGSACDAVMTGSEDGAYRNWRLPAEQPSIHVAARGPLGSWGGGFAHNGAVTVIAGDASITRTDADSGAATKLPNGPAGFSAVAISPSRDWAVFGFYDGRAVRWDLEAGRELASFQVKNPITAVAVSVDNRMAFGTADGKVTVYSLDGDMVATTQAHPHSPSWIEFSPDGRRFATVSWHGQARLWNTDDGALYHKFDRGNAHVNLAQFNHDGTRLLVVPNDRKAYLWDIAKKTRIATLRAERESFAYAAFHPGRDEIVSLDDAGVVSVWAAKTGRELARERIHNDAGYFMWFADNGDLVTLDVKNRFRVTDFDWVHHETSAMAKRNRCRIPFQLAGQAVVASKPDCSR